MACTGGDPLREALPDSGSGLDESECTREEHQTKREAWTSSVAGGPGEAG